MHIEDIARLLRSKNTKYFVSVICKNQLKLECGTKKARQTFFYMPSTREWRCSAFHDFRAKGGGWTKCAGLEAFLTFANFPLDRETRLALVLAEEEAPRTSWSAPPSAAQQARDSISQADWLETVQKLRALDQPKSANTNVDNNHDSD